MRKRNDLDDTHTRSRLENWGDWQRIREQIGPSENPEPQPMFRQVTSGYRDENDYKKRNTAIDLDDALLVESMICRLSDNHKSAIKRYFIYHQNMITCAQKARMSRRQFENWLNTAVARVDALLEAHEKDLTVTRIQSSILF